MSQRNWNCEALYKAHDQNVIVIVYKNPNYELTIKQIYTTFYSYAMMYYYGYDFDAHATLMM